MTSEPLETAVLDDYQDVARVFGPWDELGPGARVTFFHDHAGDLDALVERLAPSDAIVAMRE